MSALEELSSRAELSIVSSDRISRGSSIRRRRIAHGIPSVREFAEQTGLSRDAITGAEKGSSKTTEATYERLEAWLDEYDRRMNFDTSPAGEDVPTGGSAGAASVDELAPGLIGVHVKGPHTEWDVEFVGHREDADLLREQAERLLLNMKQREARAD